MKIRGAWVHQLNQVLLKIHPVVWLLILLLLVRGAFAATPYKEEQMAWLVVVYLPIRGDPVPYVRFYHIERELCNKHAKQIFNNVKAGQARALCMRG